MNSKHKILFIIILCLAYVFRVHGINWDHGFNLHPDERAIIMFTTDLTLPSSFSEFLSSSSPLNPQFFAYGNLPLYLLKSISYLAALFNSALGTYDSMALVGRVISAIADIGTLIVLFFISKKLFSPTVGLFSTAIYALSVFPIQAAHFYAVDILLSFFCLLTLYLLLLLAEKFTTKTSIFAGISFGLALATKVSAMVLIAPLGILVLLALLNLHKIYKSKKSLAPLRKFIFSLALLLLTVCATFVITQPYVVIDWNNFIQQTKQQSSMTHDVFTFPYTMQYYGKIPYIYEIKNIFLWGLGPVVTVLSVIGIFIYGKSMRKSIVHLQQSLVLGTFFIVYFFVVGSFAVGWMRYMLPLYPLLTLLAGLALFTILKKLQKNYYLYKIACIVLALGISYWPMSFIQIYGNQHPRVAATEWIHTTIQPGSTLATEHWDDRLPLTHSESYTFIELPMYEPESDEKWQMIEENLLYTDYIILSSNRLYTPLQKLTNCREIPEGRCYQRSAKFYEDLFMGNSNFKKVAEFTNYPTIPFFNIVINDQSADESFTVYDHPKVLIFKNTSRNTGQ